MPGEAVIERIGVEDWFKHRGHTDRYAWAAAGFLIGNIPPGAAVNDLGCGIGYGRRFFPSTVEYRGFDKPGIPLLESGPWFYPCDLDDDDWLPPPATATICFETLEHVEDPAGLARKIERTTSRLIFVSVPTVPTVHVNPFHRHDFVVGDIEPMFPRFQATAVWDQSAEQSHVWQLVRR